MGGTIAFGIKYTIEIWVIMIIEKYRDIRYIIYINIFSLSHVFCASAWRVQIISFDDLWTERNETKNSPDPSHISGTSSTLQNVILEMPWVILIHTEQSVDNFR